MRTVSATQAKQRFAELLDAAQKGPVRIQRHDRNLAALVLPRQHQRMVQQRWREFDRLSALAGAQAKANGLNAEKLQEILAER